MRFYFGDEKKITAINPFYPFCVERELKRIECCNDDQYHLTLAEKKMTTDEFMSIIEGKNDESCCEYVGGWYKPKCNSGKYYKYIPNNVVLIRDLKI